MFQKKMYVRCPVDSESVNDPRDFALAQIVDIDDLAETVTVHFYDHYHISQFYPMPEEYTLPQSQVTHAQCRRDATVWYHRQAYVVKACIQNTESGYYEYFLAALQNEQTVRVCETEIEASFNDSEINPYIQLLYYEFQNPVWFFGRRRVSQTMQSLDSAIYGFKELSGCKIYLKPHQLKTVMRCLRAAPFRNMIADEVGLGKTIEAASVLKIYLSDHRKANIVILMPDALVGQWRTELAFKFGIFEGSDSNGNRIHLIPFSQMSLLITIKSRELLIVDEVHQCLHDPLIYKQVLELSRSAQNVLMLSATPVQDRREEYYHLLRLLQPQKYEMLSLEDFEKQLERQNQIVHTTYIALSDLEDYRTEIEDANDTLSDDAQDVFDDELKKHLGKLQQLIQDNRFSKMVEQIDIHTADFGISGIQTAIAYVCEHYQLEQNIIRNRRSVLEDTANERQLVELPYELENVCNNTPLRLYRNLSDWVESISNAPETFAKIAKPLIAALFSSAAAFQATLKKMKDPSIAKELQQLADRWVQEEQQDLRNLSKILDDPYEHTTRMVRILDYIDQETTNQKILLFTAFPETFQLYQEAFLRIFDGKCCFFRKGMTANELELQTYRFQTDKNYRIMLSDESGGEGRNFQQADILIHIDLPWSTNTLEQRIGRLDRIGRIAGRPVISVVPYAQETLEEDLFRVWNNGLHIFERSQSGLEIIMNEIDDEIQQSVCEDMKYGLANEIPKLITKMEGLRETVKREQHFDVAGYLYQTLNQQLDRSVRLYAKQETALFASSMLSWAQLAGFHGDVCNDQTIRFHSASFSVKSAQNIYFVPPDMEKVVAERLNKLQNHIRKLNGEKDIAEASTFIQGTFERERAIANDYLHFFAPGDAVFDSIVENALYSFKGRCTAFATFAPLDWTGLVFTWRLRPDESVLLEAKRDVRLLNLYQGYLSGEQFTNVVPTNETYAERNDEALKEFLKLCSISVTDARKELEHLGKRSPRSPLLGIKERFKCSDIDWFRQKFPRDKWRYYIKESYQQAKKEAMEHFRKTSDLKGLRMDLVNTVSARKAVLAYFGQEEVFDKLQQEQECIFRAFRQSKVELDSVCFVRMVKGA